MCWRAMPSPRMQTSSACGRRAIIRAIPGTCLLATAMFKTSLDSRSGSESFPATIWTYSGGCRAGTQDAIRLRRSTWPRASVRISGAESDLLSCDCGALAALRLPFRNLTPGPIGRHPARIAALLERQRRIVRGQRLAVREILQLVEKQSAIEDHRLVAGAEMLLAAVSDRSHAFLHRAVLDRGADNAGEIAALHQLAILQVHVGHRMHSLVIRRRGPMTPVRIDGLDVERPVRIEVDVEGETALVFDGMPGLEQLRLVRAGRDVAVERRHPFEDPHVLAFGIGGFADRRVTHQVRRFLAQDLGAAVRHDVDDGLPAGSRPA